MLDLLAWSAAAYLVCRHGWPRLRRVASVACSYKAKALASAYFVSGLEPEPNSAPEVSDEAYYLMRFFRATVDRGARTATCSFLGLQPRVAAWRPGFGAALTRGGLPELPAPAIAPRAADFPAREIPALRPVVEAAFARAGLGADRRRTRAVVVLKDGAIAAERYAPGFGPQTPLNGWSMTKSVTGALIGTLVRDGKLALTDKDLLPEWTSPGDPRAGITLEDLLRMRSGLRFAEVYSNPLSDVTRMLYDDERGDAGGFAASRPLDHAPGTKWSYASGTTNILSLIARRRLGDEAYASWPRRALFDPLGMDSAVFETDASGTFVGSSYLFATARDWARFGALYLDGGRGLLPDGWVKFSTTPTPQAPEGKYGAHWWLKLSPELGGKNPAAAAIPPDAFHALGHEGQCVTVIPSRGLVVVRLGLSIDVKAWNHAAFLRDVLAAV